MGQHDTEESSGVAWGVEVETSMPGKDSAFHSARKVILDGEYVQIELSDGTYQAYPIEQVRKVLSMRANSRSGYTGEDLSADDLY